MGRFIWVPPLVLMALAFVFFFLWPPGVLPSMLAFLLYGFVGMPFLVVRGARANQQKNEALFRSMFPELQPHFHPERLVEYVTARGGRGPVPAASRWESPRGFAAAAVAEATVGEKSREHVRLRGQSGAVLGEFDYEGIPEGGVLRVGKGKLTVDIRKAKDPRVRYWHPEREFKWSRAGWVFKTPVADEPFESSSSSSSSSSSDSSSRAAAAAGIVGLGGTFDGGGASAGWDDGSKGGASESTGGEATGDASSDAGGGSGSTAY
jgi:uncharacterized membrane protein YgcG